MARLRRKATRRTPRIREVIHSRVQILVDLAANRIKRLEDQRISRAKTRRSKTQATNMPSHRVRTRISSSKS